MGMSMHRFKNPNVTPGLMSVTVGAIVIVFAALFTLAWQVASVARAQSVVFSLFVSALALAAAWETWRGRRIDDLRSRPVAAIALAGIALARLIRALMVLAQGIDMIEPGVGIIAQ